MTSQRAALMRLIASSEGRPSASYLCDQLKAQFPTTSRGTVYKTLNLLKELGEVLHLGFSNDDNRYDSSRPYPHPHLIWLSCCKIVAAQVNLVDDLTHGIAEQMGYQVTSRRLEPTVSNRIASKAYRTGPRRTAWNQ